MRKLNNCNLLLTLLEPVIIALKIAFIVTECFQNHLSLSEFHIQAFSNKTDLFFFFNHKSPEWKKTISVQLG